MSIPQQIVIGPYRYPVVFVDRLCNANYVRLAGQIDYEAGEIRIDPAASRQKIVVTLFHEMVHGINNVSSIEMSEDDVDRMAHNLVELLQRNPDLVALFDGDFR